MSHYLLDVAGDEYVVEMGMPEHPIMLDGQHTGLQSADASCSAERAMRLLVDGHIGDVSLCEHDSIDDCEDEHCDCVHWDEDVSWRALGVEDVERHGWSRAASYVYTWDQDGVTHAVDETIEIGCARGALWYLRVANDGGVEILDGEWTSEEDAREAAEREAGERSEADEGEDAEAYLERLDRETIEETTDDDGEWGVLWCSTGEDPRVESRHSSRKGAETAVRLLDARLGRRYPSGGGTKLLCGYQLGLYEDGEWRVI